MDIDDKDVAAVNSNGDSENLSDKDSKLARIRQRLKQMEQEAKKFSESSHYLDPVPDRSIDEFDEGNNSISEAEKVEVDARSIYVGNVEYSATAQDLQKHFVGCGAINRITIQCDKFTGNPKGFAYIEFQDTEAVDAAMALDESLFCARQIKVLPKRHNVPGISSTNRPPRRRLSSRGRWPRGGFSSHYAGVRKSRYPRWSSYY